MEEKILYFYNEFIILYKNNKYDRCIIEHYRNELSKLFKFPCGHRWKFNEWFNIQEYGFKLLLDGGKITKDEFEFYTMRIS